MEKVLKAGIIGCGGIANGKHMPSLKRNAKIEMVAFCDIIIEKAEKAAKEFGESGAKIYKDYKELLKDSSIDVAYVLTPNKEHAFITVDALEAGKHVMCEKPMAKTSAEAMEMVEAAKKSGKKLTIGYQNRFNKDSLYVKEICEAGELGDIYFAKAHAIRRRAVPTWGVFLNKEEQGGGPLIDIGTHALDLTLWTMDNYKPKMVVGKTFYKLGKQKNTGNAWGDWDTETFDVEDSAFGFITMENGAVIVLESSWALNLLDGQEAKTTLCGTEAGVDMLDGVRVNSVKHNTQVIEKPNLSGGGVAFFEGAGGDRPEDLECAEFINAILNDTEVVAKPEQAYVVTQILEAIYESDKLGKPIYL